MTGYLKVLRILNTLIITKRFKLFTFYSRYGDGKGRIVRVTKLIEFVYHIYTTDLLL